MNEREHNLDRQTDRQTDNNCTIIVNSCDSYSDVWYVFFELFRIHWRDCPYSIVLNTESKSYHHPNMPYNWVSTFGLFPNTNSSLKWTTRLVETVKRIKTEYVIMFLDDDLIIDDVDTKRIQQCIDWMNNDPKIMCFRALETGESAKHIPSEKYPGFNFDTKDSFRSSVNIMLYRRSQLLKNIIPGESPWECEGNGMFRSKFWEGEYYSSQIGAPLIPYNANMYGGYGIWHGKWREKTVVLCREHGIEFDFSKRGILTEEEIKEIREQEIAEAKKKDNEKSFSAVISRLHVKMYYVKKYILNYLWLIMNKR